MTVFMTVTKRFPHLYVELLITVNAVQGAAARSPRPSPSDANRETRDAMCWQSLAKLAWETHRTLSCTLNRERYLPINTPSFEKKGKQPSRSFENFISMKHFVPNLNWPMAAFRFFWKPIGTSEIRIRNCIAPISSARSTPMQWFFYQMPGSMWR